MSTELYSVYKGEGGPWQIICNQCGWVYFSLSPEAVAALGKDWAEQRIDDEISKFGKSHHCLRSEI